jgi:hypothetical protein
MPSELGTELGTENRMATRSSRLAEFTSNGEPPTEACEILCEDHNGTYVPRFMGCFSDGMWRNAQTGVRLEVSVIGWRAGRCPAKGPR